MMAMAGLNAGAPQILWRSGCWFRAGGVLVGLTARQVRDIESYGQTLEPASHGKKICELVA
jgi:hypothetical protein